MMTDCGQATSPRGRSRWGVAMLLGALVFAACARVPAASNSTSGLRAAPSAPASGSVLPVNANPIRNSSTAQTLLIARVLVEDNVDVASGKAAPDHLEIELRNTGTTAFTGVEIFYTYTDPTTGATEHYYAKLPDSFTIPAGGSRVAHFDRTGAPDHFADNQFSLFHNSKNALNVTVEVSAAGAAPQTMTVKKAAGGAETAD